MRNEADFHTATSSSVWMTWHDVFLQYAQPMLAIVLLLRFSSIVDEAGFAISLLLVFVTFLISFVTGWSACTVISKKSDDEGFSNVMTSYSTSHFATSFSILYIFCLLLATSIYVSAGAEALLHIPSIFSIEIFDGATHDLRIVASILSLITMILSIVRTKNARPIRFFIFALTILAVFLHLSGLMFRYGEYTLRRIPERNVVFPSPPTEEISTLFAQMFPAAICVLSILSFSEKLQSSAPRGTLLAIAVCASIYGTAAMFDYVEFFARSPNQTVQSQNEREPYIYTTVPMALVICIACIISAVTMLKYASSILQCLGRSFKCKSLLWLTVGYSSRDIPLRCLLLFSFFQTLISLVGSYDLLCIPTTVFFLISYSIFNFYVFRVKLKNPEIPSPPALLSLLIAALTLFCAIYTNRHFSLLSGAIFIFSYCFQLYYESDRDSTGEEKPSNYAPVLGQMHKLQKEPENSRHYHPQILLLTGNPAVRPALVDFADSITKGKSLFICGYVIPQKPCSRSYLLQCKIDKQMNDWLHSRDIDAFGSAICCANQAEGANTLLQTVGLGRLRPNILMLGFKTNWNKEGILNYTAINEYYGMLSNAFEKQVGLILFRNEISGFDLSSSLRRNNGEPIDGDEELADYVESRKPVVTEHREKRHGAAKGKILNSVQTQFRKISMAATKLATKDLESGRNGNRFEVIDKFSVHESDQKIIMSQLFRFRKRVVNARIDVYWLREAGGLTMLVPYLLAQAGSYLEGAHLRVFTRTFGTDNRKINEEQKNMASVLRTFNINSSDLHILPEFSKAPSKEVTDSFNKLIEPFKVPRGVDKLPGMFDDDELFNLREKTRNYLRASELIKQHSTDADLIVCTLPSARPEIPATLYMSWIEMLTKQTPPTCLVRGNQVSLTAMNLKFP